jgi:short-subunit dehydrogenase
MKPIAIITGATGGLGEAFAHELARQNYDLLLTGRNTSQLSAIRQKLEAQFDVRIYTVSADLTVSQDLQRLIATIHRLHRVEILVNNAGFGNHQNFFESDFEDQQQLLQIHVAVTTKLVHEVVPLMMEHHKGFIINVSSLAAFLPSGESYFYCASKAFMVTFSECMSIALRKKGIVTQALCPGFVDTGFHQHVNTSKCIDHQWLWMSPQEVVNRSLKSLSKHKVLCIPGFVNRFIYHVVRHLPKVIYYQLSSKQQMKNEQQLATVLA